MRPRNSTPEKMKIVIQNEHLSTCILAALFTTAKTWKQPNCLSTDDWLRKKFSTIVILGNPNLYKTGTTKRADISSLFYIFIYLLP